MNQREYVDTLAPHDLAPDDDLKNLKDSDIVKSPTWIKRFRGANGAVQWLSTNTRPDLAADTSISAGTSGVGITKASIANAQKSSGRPMHEVTQRLRSDRLTQTTSVSVRFTMRVGHADQTDRVRVTI